MKYFYLFALIASTAMAADDVSSGPDLQSLQIAPIAAPANTTVPSTWATTVVSPAAPSAPAVPATNVASGPEVLQTTPSPLIFKGTPLRDVAKVISGRLNADVVIQGDDTKPVSGDYSHTDLHSALRDAAGQAGFVVLSISHDGIVSYQLVSNDTTATASKDAHGLALFTVATANPDFSTDASLEIANQRRAEILKKRQSLLEAEAQLKHP